MAIDYKALKTQKQEELKGLLSQPVDMSGIEKSVSDSRGDFLSKAGLSGSSALGEATQMPSLERKTASNIARTGYDANRQRQDQMFTELMNMATDSGMNLTEAKNYAYKVMAQQQEQGWQAGENQKNRDLKQKIANLGDQYADQGIALSDQYQPSYDPTGAVLRMLLGTGTMVGMSQYYQNKLNQQQPVQTQMKTPVYTQPSYPTTGQTTRTTG
jgi:hypothetical protein